MVLKFWEGALGSVPILGFLVHNEYSLWTLKFKTDTDPYGKESTMIWLSLLVLDLFMAYEESDLRDLYQAGHPNLTPTNQS